MARSLKQSNFPDPQCPSYALCTLPPTRRRHLDRIFNTIWPLTLTCNKQFESKQLHVSPPVMLLCNQKETSIVLWRILKIAFIYRIWKQNMKSPWVWISTFTNLMLQYSRDDLIARRFRTERRIRIRLGRKVCSNKNFNDLWTNDALLDVFMARRIVVAFQLVSCTIQTRDIRMNSVALPSH